MKLWSHTITVSNVLFRGFSINLLDFLIWLCLVCVFSPSSQ